MNAGGRGVRVSMVGRVAPWARRHRWFLGVLALGTALRVVTMLGYRPALWFPDSYSYVVTAMRPKPDLVRPAGYSMFLRLFEPLHGFGFVTLAQHLLGLLTGVMIYLAVVRRRRPRWVGALASAPVLLDAYQIQLEHLLVSDSLFTFLIVAAVCLTLRPLTWRTALATGLLLAAATLTRTVALPLIAAFGILLLWFGSRAARAGNGTAGGAADGGTGAATGRASGRVRRGRLPWRVTGVFLAAALVPVAAYGGWFWAAHHRVGLIGANGVFLYARTMSFADCAVMRPPADLAVLCDDRPPARRPPSQEYIWDPDAPLVRLPGITFLRETDALAGRFAWLAIRSQPLDYVATTMDELARSFVWGRPVYPDAETYGYYEFPADTPGPPGRHPAIVGTRFAEQYERGPIGTRVVEPYAGVMRAYQSVAFLPGVLLLPVLLFPPLVAVARFAVRRLAPSKGTGAGSRRAEAWRAAWAVPWAVAGLLLFIPAATAEFDYRYVLPATPLACLAAALMVRPRSRR
ncbi:phospholipid carrier-dependent glycosyltransferase [Microtetraspora sp. AC03309]|uniref:phospholipid carrier-dependent glycosyltransferase n=1 Tax=Microtetraspora sp. AC03309 TaxID=2779376 RepID=UPI001E421C7E|nr:phospholipid carrier-dependent glycosyltransferase [Microtetraspora sp. AC03309]